MSGSNIAYHLRPNKNVERNLFLALLDRIRVARPIMQYRYISLGGPLLEDFRAMHERLGISNMQSIDQNERVVLRQKFNQPVGCIKLLTMGSNDFIERYEAVGSSIVWLDYTTPRALREQLQEFETLLSKSNDWDVIKLTLNANPASLGTAAGVGEVEQREARLQKLLRLIGDWVPNGLEAARLTSNSYPAVLLEIVLNRAAAAFPPTLASEFRVLSAFAYSDGTQMLTVTGIVAPRDQVGTFLERIEWTTWPFSTENCATPVRIEVPSLSTRERHAIDKSLPAASLPDLVATFGFLSDEDDDEAEAMLASYAQFYRYYPHFGRIVP